MSLTGKKFDSALEILITISMQSSLLPVSSRDIADSTSLSLRYVETIIQSLVKNKVLKSVRGAHGGYLIIKDRRKIKLDEIFSCFAKDDKKSKEYYSNLKKSGGSVEELNEIVEDAIKKRLSEITLEDIVSKYNAEKNNSKVKGKLGSDFVI